jgi:L-iditol 2-dehydrogenase
MKALVLKAYNQFEYTDVPAPEIGPDDVLIAVKACGICGSDVHGMDGSTGRRRPPLVMGHEAAGVIARVGANVGDWKPGDRVTFDSTIYCGQCHFCRQGRINLCDHRRVLGVACAEYSQPGAFAEFVAVPRHILYRLPDSLSFERAALVEALSIAVHAVGRAKISPADTALVAGAGMIGLLVIQALRAAGCGRIVAADIDPQKLELAKQFGAEATLRADAQDVPGELRKLTADRGADVALEVVGLAATVKLAALSLRKGGTLVLVGNLAPAVELPLQAVVTRELALLGSCASCGEYPACLDLLARGTVKTDGLLSAVVPLAEGAAWFDRLYRKEKGLMKVVLVP